MNTSILNLHDGIAKPRTNIQEVLFEMISSGEVSIMDFPYLSGFRTRVSELHRKYGIKIKTISREGVNKFGNKYKYAVHSPIDYAHALDVYKEMSSKVKILNYGNVCDE